MSTYVYMKILESAPRRYDLGLGILSLGHIRAVYEAAAAAAVPEGDTPRVLELGCGTGSLTRELLARGARVTAIDFNPDMLAIASEKLGSADGRLALREMAVVEIADRFPPGSFDVVAATLVFSELSPDERAYVLRGAWSVLRPGGRLVIADEILPENLIGRLLHGLIRFPLALVTYILTQTSTSAVADPAGLVAGAGFRLIERKRLHGTGLIVAERPQEQD